MAGVLRADKEGRVIALAPGRRPLRVIPKGGHSRLEVGYKLMFVQHLKGQTGGSGPRPHKGPTGAGLSFARKAYAPAKVDKRGETWT